MKTQASCLNQKMTVTPGCTLINFTHFYGNHQPPNSITETENMSQFGKKKKNTSISNLSFSFFYFYFPTSTTILPINQPPNPSKPLLSQPSLLLLEE